LDTTMLIGIGSNTKTFLSALMLKLYENGQINLTDTIGTWITGYPNINGAITIRQLLTHTSGIAEYLDNDVYNAMVANPNKHWTRAELFDLIGSPYFNPGASIEYSNSNYIIAGEIIEAVTSTPLHTLLRDSIFNVAGLQHTFYPPFEVATSPYAGYWTDVDGNGMLDLACDWNAASSIFPVNINTVSRDAGAIVATSKDVVTFWKKLLEGGIIASSTLQQEMMRWSGFGNANSEYGLGIFLEKYKGIPMFHHGGTWLGQINSNLSDTTHKIYIAVLSNQDSLDNEFTEMVAKVMYDILYQEHTLAIHENSNGVNIKMYPNPCVNYLTIQVPDAVHMAQVSISSVDGRKLVEHNKVDNGLIKIDMQHLATGTYMVSLSINNVHYNYKVVKM
jgi:D-alanyl-D-alanine carboxypeptidase